MTKKGETWNESTVYEDPITLRKVRRVTSAGLYNNTPTYHTNTGFTADGEYLVFASARQGRSAIMSCHVPTGEIRQLTAALDGVDSYGMLLKMGGLSYGNGMGVDIHMCIAPRTGWVVYVGGWDLCAVNLYTLEERILVPGIGPEHTWGVPSVDPTETNVVISLGPAHPEILAGQRVTRPYREHFSKGGLQMKLIQVPLAGGPAVTVYLEDGVWSNHTAHSPTDPDLLLIDRDPPGYRYPTGAVTNRIWTLRLSTGELTEIPPKDESRFQVHSTWTLDGEQIVYHGPSVGGGWYIGVATADGRTVQEYTFPEADSYGHVTADSSRPAIILDGNLSVDLLQWLYYDSAKPRVEVIARHGTDWTGMIGQYPHPHPLCDPTGRWISFNAAQRGRSDVYVVEV